MQLRDGALSLLSVLAAVLPSALGDASPRCQANRSALRLRQRACDSEETYPVWVPAKGKCRREEICWELGPYEAAWASESDCEDACIEPSCAAESSGGLYCSLCYRCRQGQCYPDFERRGCWNYRYHGRFAKYNKRNRNSRRSNRLRRERNRRQ